MTGIITQKRAMKIKIKMKVNKDKKVLLGE
jgi:hypothetical protein